MRPKSMHSLAGQRIWGLPRATIPGVVIKPGSEGVVLSTLTFQGGLLYFAGGAGGATTQFNTFHRIAGAHVVFGAGARVADCSFVGLTDLGCGPACGGPSSP